MDENNRVKEQHQESIRVSKQEESSFGIYQLKGGEALHYYRFESLDNLSRHGLQVEKKNYELIHTAPLQEGQTLDDIFEQFNMFRPEDFTGHSLSVSDIVLIHKDGVNTAHYVDSIGFQEIPDFLELQAEHEVGQVMEAAYVFADRYLMIHECDDGYDYTFYDKDYKEMDGGVYDNPDITLEEAVHIILTDDPFPNMERTPVDYEELDEKVEVANQISKPQVRKGKVAPLSDRAEAMQELNGMSPAEVEETVLAYVQTKAEEYGYEVQILAARVYGSRTGGIERPGSDLDVVIEYRGDIREDDFFSMLHEDGLYIGGMLLDINPITADKSGTIEEYLARANEYLEEKIKSTRETMSDKEKVEITMEDPTQTLTFYVAECMEFTNLGECHENLTLEEAVRLYESIPAERMNGIKGIGFTLHKEGEEAYMDGTMAILDGNVIDVDIINHVMEFRENPLIQRAVGELIQHFPDAEVWNRETKAIKLRKSLEGFEQECIGLSVEIDQFCEDYDTYEYRDITQCKEESIQNIHDLLYDGDTAPVKDWLKSVIKEEEPVEDVARAKKLLKKVNDLAERRERNPLAKVEELEEANYNQIDGMLNNPKPKEEERAESSLSIMEKLERNREKIASQNPSGKSTKDLEKRTERGMV